MIRKRLACAAGVLVFSAVAITIYPFIVGEGKMKKFCSAVESQSTRSELVARATAAKYTVREIEDSGKEMVLVIDSRAMGRFICEVILEKGVATSSRFVFND